MKDSTPYQAAYWEVQALWDQVLTDGTAADDAPAYAWISADEEAEGTIEELLLGAAEQHAWRTWRSIKTLLGILAVTYPV